MALLEAHETLLTRLAHADGVLRPVEAHTIGAILKRLSEVHPSTHRKMTKTSARDSLSSETVGAIAELSARPLCERERIVQLLWVVALCDGELHPREEALVYQFADALGVSRATVARQQPDI